MTIAAIIPGLPEPADRGTYKRYRAWIRALGAIDDLDLVCLRDRDDSDESIQIVAEHCHRLLTLGLIFSRGVRCQPR